ncbi:MAG TPA: sulfatase-like hydrolase/transferase, partial [Planctomycetaceae bacterium]|nr:sulfatase-like hydrolase/transferase [Planctomycetaceae bacterium]
CSPSRTALSTGQYPQRWRINSYLNNRADNAKRGVADWLDPQAPMLARTLHDAGYATGHFGKWHMGGQRDVGEAPLISEYGFDASLTNFEGLGPRVLPLLEAYDGKPARKHALGSDLLGRGDITWQERSLVTAAFVEAATKFIDQAQKDAKPFFINLWPDDVHSPFFPPKARRGMGKRAMYLGALDTMDEQLGGLFDKIRNDERLRTNTLILVCSDNGPEPGAGTAGPFRGGKTMLYEGGLRSPLVAWGPKLIAPDRAGTVNRESFFAAIDIAPTLLRIAGVAPPEGVVIDGVALPDVLLGRSTASRNRPLFFRRPPDRPSAPTEGDLPDLAVRDGRWKLLCEYDGSKPQVYDLDQDRGETKNLAAEQPEVVQRLTTAVRDWHASLPPDKGPDYEME